MTRKALVAAALTLTALPAPARAQDQGNFFVRNDTRDRITCGLRREHGSLMDRFVLAAGEAWRSEQAGSAPRVLICDVGQIYPHFRLRPGVRYSVVDAGHGSIQVRIASSGG